MEERRGEERRGGPWGSLGTDNCDAEPASVKPTWSTTRLLPSALPPTGSIVTWSRGTACRSKACARSSLPRRSRLLTRQETNDDPAAVRSCQIASERERPASRARTGNITVVPSPDRNPRCGEPQVELDLTPGW